MNTVRPRTHSRSQSQSQLQTPASSGCHSKSSRRVRIEPIPTQVFTIPNRRDERYPGMNATAHHRSSSHDHKTTLLASEMDGQRMKGSKDTDRMYPGAVKQAPYWPQQARGGQERRPYGSVDPHHRPGFSPFPGVPARLPKEELYNGYTSSYPKKSRRHSLDTYGAYSAPTQYPQPAPRHRRSSSTTVFPAPPPPIGHDKSGPESSKQSFFARLGQRVHRGRYASTASSSTPTIVVVLPNESAAYHHHRYATRYG